MLQIVCVLRSGGDYTADHVNALRANCTQYMPPHRFICLTDVSGIDGGVALQHNWPGWWSKLEAFGTLVPNAPTLVMDLDTVLVGPCHDIMTAASGHAFVILRDVYRGQINQTSMQSSVMFWNSRPPGIYDKFTSASAEIMRTLRGDQDFLETVVSDATYWQDICTGFASFKADIRQRGLQRTDRVIIFHGKPRPWEQDIVPYGDALTVRDGWVVASTDTCGIQAALRESPHIDIMLRHCGTQRRTAIQAGGNVGVWPKALSQHFQRVVTMEAARDNFAALLQNTHDVHNIECIYAAAGDRQGDVGMVRVPGNAGAHHVSTTVGTDTPMRTIDSLGITDCDLLQLDVEGSEHAALLGAQQTVATSSPTIVLELKGLGRRYGYIDKDTINMLTTWGYQQIAHIGRDVILVHHTRATSKATLQPSVSYAPVRPDESCILVGNGPSIVRWNLGQQIDAFDQVVRFNNFRLGGLEAHTGHKTTLWATFGRGMTPQDSSPDRIIYIHGNNGDPALPAKELWRIDRDFYWRIVDGWRDAIGGRGNQLLPSTGFLVAMWLLHVWNVPKLWLAGFDHFDKSQTGMHHYWVRKSFTRPREHDGGREAAEFARLEKEGRIAYLRGPAAEPPVTPDQPPIVSADPFTISLMLPPAKRPPCPPMPRSDVRLTWVLPDRWKQANHGASLRASTNGTASTQVELPEDVWLTVQSSGFIGHMEGCGLHISIDGVAAMSLCAAEDWRQSKPMEAWPSSVRVPAGHRTIGVQFTTEEDGHRHYCHATITLTRQAVSGASAPSVGCAPPVATGPAYQLPPHLPHWGPPKWAELHAHQIDVGNDGANEEWLQRFAHSLPQCRDCQRHFADLLAQYPPVYASQEQWYDWTVFIHNRVNERLGKPQWEPTAPASVESPVVLRHSDPSAQAPA